MLRDEIETAKRTVSTDSVQMTIGEVAHLYGANELNILPDFQRLFRWSPSKKSNFVESILIGIPIPPAFVYENEDGTWELIDGLQRISTILEFMGILRDPDTAELKRSQLMTTKYLPSLDGIVWNAQNDGEKELDRPSQYANWEGFYNDCVRTYVEFLRSRGRKIRETDWMLLVGACNSDFDSLRDRNHSVDARYNFVANLRERLECRFDAFDRSCVEAKANLDFRRVTQCYTILNFSTQTLEKFRIRIDAELVGWRHSVAHGDSPDLSALDIANHIDFASHLFLVLADQFQYAMLERM
jgi:hypothetical protein